MAGLTIAGSEAGERGYLDSPSRGISALFDFPADICLDLAERNFYVTEYAGDRVRRISTETPHPTNTAAQLPAGSRPYGINRHPTQDLFYIACKNGKIYTLTGTGVLTEAADTAGLYEFYSVVADATGRFWAAANRISGSDGHIAPRIVRWPGAIEIANAAIFKNFGGTWYDAATDRLWWGYGRFGPNTGAGDVSGSHVIVSVPASTNVSHAWGTGAGGENEQRLERGFLPSSIRSMRRFDEDHLLVVFGPSQYGLQANYRVALLNISEPAGESSRTLTDLELDDEVMWITGAVRFKGDVYVTDSGIRMTTGFPNFSDAVNQDIIHRVVKIIVRGLCPPHELAKATAVRTRVSPGPESPLRFSASGFKSEIYMGTGLCGDRSPANASAIRVRARTARG